MNSYLHIFSQQILLVSYTKKLTFAIRLFDDISIIGMVFQA
jgi:hypothetical protein